MKFKLRKDISKELNGVKLFRIEYENGFLGGWLEKEANLCQDGKACVQDEACVFDNARVAGDADVFGDARVSGGARVYGNARVSGNAWVAGDAYVSGDARVSGDAYVFGNANVYNNARVSGNASVYGKACVSGNAIVSNDKECINIILPFKHSITITKNHIQIGCEIHKIEHWKKEIKKIGKKYDYTEEEIKSVILLLKGALKMRGTV